MTMTCNYSDLNPIKDSPYSMTVVWYKSKISDEKSVEPFWYCKWGWSVSDSAMTTIYNTPASRFQPGMLAGKLSSKPHREFYGRYHQVTLHDTSDEDEGRYSCGVRKEERNHTHTSNPRTLMVGEGEEQVERNGE